ncbi:MAG: SanA/YdcF family protein [Acidimicrobiales bacterium]
MTVPALVHRSRRVFVWSVAAAGVAGFVAAAASMAARLYLLASRRCPVVHQPALVDADLAAVLGAGVRPDGSATRLLARRVDAAVDLYERGLVGSIVMSGADSASGDEPGAMEQRALELGVPVERITLDRTGVNTAATCRGLAIDYPEASIALVTQAFHAGRTSYLAAKAGLDAVVFATPDADVRPLPRAKATVRELPASIKALFVDRF